MNEDNKLQKILMIGVIAIIFIVVGVPISRNLYTSVFIMDFDKINVHELIQSEKEAEKLVAVMDDLKIKSTILSGTSNEELFYTGEEGFTGYDENNEELLKILNRYGKRFIVFCTINPADTDKLVKLQSCIDKRGRGLKLYSGHSFFYQKDYPLDAITMENVYNYVEKKGLPVIFQVNLGFYRHEFENVLKQHPSMKVVCPHFCVSFYNLKTLGEMFDKYPNLYTDIGFGYREFLLDRLQSFSDNTQKYRSFINKYKTRFLFGTDIVITGHEAEKTEEWIKKVYQVYIDLLEKNKFTFFLNNDPNYVYNGLSLDKNVLQAIYQDNFNRLME